MSSGDRDDSGTPHVALIAMVLISGVVGFIVIDTVTDERFEEYVEESAEWCDERNGDLYNSRALWHGGLHCELPSGETVHMSDVIDYGE